MLNRMIHFEDGGGDGTNLPQAYSVSQANHGPDGVGKIFQKT